MIAVQQAYVWGIGTSIPVLWYKQKYSRLCMGYSCLPCTGKVL